MAPEALVEASQHLRYILDRPQRLATGLGLVPQREVLSRPSWQNHDARVLDMLKHVDLRELRRQQEV